MYKLIKRLNKHYVKFVESNTMYLINNVVDKGKKIPYLIQMDADLNELFRLSTGKYPRLSFHEDVFFVGSGATKKFSIYERHTNKKIISYDEELIIGGGFPYKSSKEKEYYFVKKNKGIAFSRDDWSKREFQLEYSIMHRVSHPEYNLFTNLRKSILYAYNSGMTQLVWQKDFSKIAEYLDVLTDEPMRGEVYDVQLYKEDKIIVTTLFKDAFCLDVATGKELWRTWTFGGRIEIVGNIGYVCTGASLFKINLDTGEAIMNTLYPDNSFPDIEYNNRTYSATGGIVYHEGWLWHTVYDSGQAFIIAINPHNGNYEWVHHVETNGEIIHDVDFLKDKMFLRDSGGVLHAYEKEK